MRQILIDFGTLNLLGAKFPLHIYGYGLMMVLGFITAIYLAQWRARRMGENPECLMHVGILALIGGIVGARIAYIIQHWDSQFAGASNVLGAVLNITSGGLIYYGGVALATLLVIGYLYIRRLPARRYLDIVAVSMMAGLAFGRCGCLLNGCCYGALARQDSWLGMRFPMYSQPLLKLDGSAGPFSTSTESPSPVYSHQLELHLVEADERLVSRSPFGEHLRLPRELHGPLAGDQLTTVMGDPAAWPAEFHAVAGPDGKVGRAEWDRALARPSGLLRGSEDFDEALVYDKTHDGRLSFDEMADYLRARKEWVIQKFGAPRAASLTVAEYQKADQYFQADLLALAADQWSLKVKPAQAIGIANAVLLAVMLSVFFRLRTREGQVFALMVIIYPVTRFIEEAIRDDNPHNVLQGILTHNQYTSLAMMAAGIVLFAVLRRWPASAGGTWSQRLAAAGAGARGTRRK